MDMYMGGGDEDLFDVEDSAVGLIELADNRTILFDVAWAANMPSAHRYLVKGTESGAVLSLPEGDDNELQFHEVGHADTDHFLDRQIDLASQDPREEMIQAFLRHVHTGAEIALPTVREAFVVQRIISAIYDDSTTVQPS
jgi:predicted dehydrogenase